MNQTMSLFTSYHSGDGGEKNDGPHSHISRQLIKLSYGKINVPIQKLTQ